MMRHVHSVTPLFVCYVFIILFVLFESSLLLVKMCFIVAICRMPEYITVISYL